MFHFLKFKLIEEIANVVCINCLLLQFILFLKPFIIRNNHIDWENNNTNQLHTFFAANIFIAARYDCTGELETMKRELLLETNNFVLRKKTEKTTKTKPFSC